MEWGQNSQTLYSSSQSSRKLLPSIQIMIPFLQYALTFLLFLGTILASLHDRNGWHHGRDWWNAPRTSGITLNPSKIRPNHDKVSTILPDHTESSSRPSRPCSTHSRMISHSSRIWHENWQVYVILMVGIMVGEEG